MLDLIALLIGATLIALVFLDALATTLHVGAGAGPLTRRVAGLAWRSLLRLHRRDSESVTLSAAGVVLLIGTVLIWVTGLWAGWVLVLLGGDSDVVESTTRAPAGTVDLVYYVGFTVFTLGVGDFVASTPIWRVATSVASFTGLFLITLAITYLISVVSAVVARRALAIRINALGGTASEIVAHGWTGDGFSSAYVQQLVALTDQLAVTAEQHLAYPILHYFHSRDRGTSAPIAVAKLDEAMMILAQALAPPAQPDRSAVQPVRDVINRYLTTASATSAMLRQPDPPPAPNLGPLVAADIPIVDAAEFDRHVKAQSARRRSLHQLVNSDGWSWSGQQS